MSETTSFSVNGRDVQVRADHPHLLAALREEIGITSAKDGCSPSGQCGACVVLLDGKAIHTAEKGRNVATDLSPDPPPDLAPLVSRLHALDDKDRKTRLPEVVAAADAVIAAVEGADVTPARRSSPDRGSRSPAAGR